MTVQELVEFYQVIKRVYIKRGYSAIQADTHASILTYAIKVNLLDYKSVINKILLYAQESECTYADT